MLDGPVITKQLASNNEKNQFAALLLVANFLNTTDAKDLPLMLLPALETMLRSGDLPTKHRVLMYGMARRCSTLHPALLAAIIADLEDTTVNDPACLSAAANSLPILPVALILNFFARPGNEEGSYSCEESSEAINRCIGHEDARVRCGTIPGLIKAAIVAYGAVHGTEGLQSHSSSRAHESWAAAVRFKDVLHDHVGELLNKLSNLVVEDRDERVVATAASSLHQTMKGAVLIGKIEFEGDQCWSLEGANFILVDVIRGIDERGLMGREWCDFTVQGARSLFDLCHKVLGAKEAKLNQLVQRTLQSTPGSLAHPSLLRFGSDLVILRLYLTSMPHYHLQSAQQAALHWANCVLAKEACSSSSWEDSLAGNSQLLRLLHLPCLRHVRGLLANAVFETCMAATRGAMVQQSTGQKKELAISYRPQLYHHVSNELLSAEDISLVACAVTALPWCSHNQLLPYRFARCLRLICLIEELPVRCGLLSALTATLMTDPTSGVRPASSISAVLGSSQTLDILQDRAPRKLSDKLNTAQLKHELASALLKASAHSLSIVHPSRAAVFRLDRSESNEEDGANNLLESLRWAEAAVVILAREFRGWKLSECLSWPCADIDSDNSFPSAIAPLSFIKLMALVFHACGRAKLQEFKEESHMSVEDEASVRSEVSTLDESISALQTRDTAAKNAGEAEISQALQSTLSGEELRRSELLRSLQSPKQQWTSGWMAVWEELSKLSRDLVVWTLGRGIKDRGVRIALLSLLADQWAMLTEKRPVDNTSSSGSQAVEAAIGGAREGTPDSHSDFGGGQQWDMDSFGRTSHSAGRSDQGSLSQGDSFEECDDMSFSEGALSEDLARELIRELSRAEPSIKYEVGDNQEEANLSKGLIGGGSCLRTIAPPSASLAYHQALVAASLRLAKTCPQTAPLFLSAFVGRISSARSGQRVAREVGSTLSGYDDTRSEIEPLLNLLSDACFELVRMFPKLGQIQVQDEDTQGAQKGQQLQSDSVESAASQSTTTTGQGFDAFRAPSTIDFFAAADMFASPPAVATTTVASFNTPAVYTTPPRTSVSIDTLTPQSTAPSLQLIQFVLSICDRGYSFGERFWHSKSDPYGNMLTSTFENQLDKTDGLGHGTKPSLLFCEVGGCADPLVGNLSVRVHSSHHLAVQLVLHNTTACALVGVGGRITGADPQSVDTLPSGATVRFQWNIPQTVKNVNAQVFFRRLELEANSDSEEEVEDAFNDDGDDEVVDDFEGDDFGGGGGGSGENVPSLVKSFLAPISLRVYAATLLTSAHLTPHAFLGTWPHLPFSRHVHGIAENDDIIAKMLNAHSSALVPSPDNSSKSMKFYSFAWKGGKFIVGAVVSAVLCENSEPRQALDLLTEVRKVLNLDITLPHNEALLQAVRVTGVASSSDPDLLVRRVALALKLNTHIYKRARWAVDMEVRCDDECFLKELMENRGGDWLNFMGKGDLTQAEGVLSITLGKAPTEGVQNKSTGKSMVAAWRKLKEEQKQMGIL